MTKISLFYDKMSYFFSKIASFLAKFGLANYWIEPYLKTIMFNLKTSTTMTLVKRNNSLFPAFSSMFDDFFTNDFALKNTSLATVPAVNIREDENGFAVELAAPGKQKSDFQINLEHNVLSISSESKQENEEKDEKGRYTRREFSYSSFQRSFVLPNSVDGDKISATYENGVLHIQIPKKEEVKKKPTRTIEIA